MPSPQFAETLLSLETRRVLSIPLAVLITGAFTQAETLMELVDRVCDRYSVTAFQRRAIAAGSVAEPLRR